MHELGARLRIIDCATLANPLGLIGHLCEFRDGDVVFLDEIHALSKAIVECFYPAIEDGFMPLRFTDGIQVKTVQLTLPKLTWVAATTNPERVPGPLLNRFRTIEIGPYDHYELAITGLSHSGGSRIGSGSRSRRSAPSTSPRSSPRARSSRRREG